MPLWWYLGGHVVFMSMCTLFPSYFSNLKTYFQQIGRKCVIWELCFDVDHIFICNIYTYVLYIFIIYIITYIYIYIHISLKSTQYDEKIEHTYLHIYSFETKTQRVFHVFPQSSDVIFYNTRTTIYKFVYIWLTISSCYGSIPLALGLIGKDGGLNTLCHSCGFACQQRVLKTFPGPGYLHSKDGVVWLWH